MSFNIHWNNPLFNFQVSIILQYLPDVFTLKAAPGTVCRLASSHIESDPGKGKPLNTNKMCSHLQYIHFSPNKSLKTINSSRRIFGPCSISLNCLSFIDYLGDRLEQQNKVCYVSVQKNAVIDQSDLGILKSCIINYKNILNFN